MTNDLADRQTNWLTNWLSNWLTNHNVSFYGQSRLARKYSITHELHGVGADVLLRMLHSSVEKR